MFTNILIELFYSDRYLISLSERSPRRKRSIAQKEKRENKRQRHKRDNKKQHSRECGASDKRLLGKNNTVCPRISDPFI